MSYCLNPSFSQFFNLAVGPCLIFRGEEQYWRTRLTKFCTQRNATEPNMFSKQVLEFFDAVLLCPTAEINLSVDKNRVLKVETSMNLVKLIWKEFGGEIMVFLQEPIPFSDRFCHLSEIQPPIFFFRVGEMNPLLITNHHMFYPSFVHRILQQQRHVSSVCELELMSICEEPFEDV